MHQAEFNDKSWPRYAVLVMANVKIVLKLNWSRCITGQIFVPGGAACCQAAGH